MLPSPYLKESNCDCDYNSMGELIVPLPVVPSSLPYLTSYTCTSHVLFDLFSSSLSSPPSVRRSQSVLNF